MRSVSLVLGVAFLLGAAQAADDTPLSTLDFLAGHCWRGEFEGSNASDTHCFTWVFGGKHLRDVHVVSGDGPEYRGETIYSVDGASGDVIYRYWNSDGGISDGRIEFENGEILAPSEQYVGDDGKPRKFRSRLRQIDEAHYEAVTEERVGDEWSNFARIRFMRIGEAPGE